MNLVLGSAAYNEDVKARFKKEGLALLRKVAKILELPKGSFKVRFNPGGIAVSGDCILHADTFYVSFNLDCCNWVLVRRCNGQKDFVGGRNHQYPFEGLQRFGAEGLADCIRMVLKEILQ